MEIHAAMSATLSLATCKGAIEDGTKTAGNQYGQRTNAEGYNPFAELVVPCLTVDDPADALQSDA
jgi:hypothetical protein